MKTILSLLLLLLVCTKGFCQIAVGYYPFNNSLIQLSSDPEHLLFADLKMQTNSYLYNSSVELAPFINLRRGEITNIYAGPGISISPFSNNNGTEWRNGYFFTVGARIKPLKVNRNFAVVFELSPFFNGPSINNTVKTNLGLSYRFTRKSKKK